MILSYYFNLDFSEDETKKVVEFINSAISQDAEIHFYINSPGGYSHCMSVVRNLLENYPFSVTLFASGEIASAAFNLFYTAKNVQKVILPHCWALIHTSSQPFEDRDVRKNDHWYKQVKKKLDEMNNSAITILKANKAVSSTQLKMFEKGEDIILLDKELHKLMLKCPYGIYTPISDFLS